MFDRLNDHRRKRQTKKEAADMRRLSGLLAATAASARHNGILDCIQATADATSGKDLGARLGGIEAEARAMLVKANERAGLTTPPRDLPTGPTTSGIGLWLPPGSKPAGGDEK